MPAPTEFPYYEGLEQTVYIAEDLSYIQNNASTALGQNYTLDIRKNIGAMVQVWNMLNSASIAYFQGGQSQFYDSCKNGYPVIADNASELVTLLQPYPDFQAYAQTLSADIETVAAYFQDTH